MQNLIAVLVLTVAVSQLLPQSSRITRSEPLLVRSVASGDTLEIAAVGRVRLLGVAAPSLGRGYDTPAPFAREAREHLATLVLNRWIRLEWDGAVDARGRKIAYVMREDGLFVNAEMIRAGLARVSARVVVGRLSELRRAEAEAQAFRRGMWGGGGANTPPGYTRGSCAPR